MPRASKALVFLTCLIGTCTHLSSAAISNETQLFNSLLQDYDKDASPGKFTGQPTNVQVGLYMNAIEISNENSDMTFTGYLRLTWEDPRLKYAQGKHSSASNPKDALKLPVHSLEKIWIPDVFMRNAISNEFHDLITPNRLLRLNQSGSIWFVTKVTVVLACDSKNPRRYPFETLVCNLLFESFSHTTDTLTISTMEHALDLPERPVRGFSILDTESSDCTQNYTAGTFPCLGLSISFKRVSSFVSRVCIPSVLLVIVSWISFWIDRESTAVRLMTGFLPLIAMALVLTHSQKSPAFASYTTLQDAWLLVSFVFIFASILEYFLVVVMSRKSVCALPSLEPGSEVKGSKEADNGKRAAGNGKRAAGWIDWISRIAFPVAFAIFIIIFFCL